MPSPTVEQLQKKEISLKKALADLGEAPDQAKHRVLRKKLKRTQRRRRLEAVLVARHAPKPKAEAPKAEAQAAAPKAEAQAAAPKAEAQAATPKAEAQAAESKEAVAEAEAPAETPSEEPKAE